MLESPSRMQLKLPEFLAIVPVNIAGMLVGCAIGWSSPSVPHLQAPDSPLPITLVDASWISSLMPLGAALGALPAGYIGKILGRKKSLMLSAIPALIGFVCLGTAAATWLLYLGRFLSGITVGWVFTIIPMYIGEVAHASVRGFYSALVNTFVILGIILDYSLGPYVAYAWLSYITAVIAAVQAVSFLFVPESPYYLLGRGDREGAEKNLRWLRGTSDVAEEMDSVQKSVDRKHTGGFKDLIAPGGNRKGFLLLSWLMAFQNLSGAAILLFYAQDIFDDIGGSLTPELSALVCGLMKLFVSFFVPTLTERLGRRLLLLASGVAMVLSYFSLGLCFYLTDSGIEDAALSYISMISLIIALVGFSAGLAPLPVTIMSEILAEDIKPVASAITTSGGWLISFLVSFAFNYMVEGIGNSYTFWIFTIICFFYLLFTYFMLPETKGKTLLQVQEMLEGR